MITALEIKSTVVLFDGNDYGIGAYQLVHHHVGGCLFYYQLLFDGFAIVSTESSVIAYEQWFNTVDRLRDSVELAA